ncbi:MULTISPECIES: MerR family transcriptional regulator [Arthrobacter]|uniref:MerR family transcriptional regulator n=2 Tax=Arthrobacter TaxID=1663 RepID=A0ABU9KJ71_9MICC|nr:MerR family transcriptional regulator [Arthrobacter sp. YJM1]MDP5226231.1 MerR family transcriptional regulator [Arthrobacter sp. YJM1]
MAFAQPGGRRSGTAVVLNIGEVLARLSEDFPGISASKIRFLEEKGLIAPQRTPAGYRQYSDSDVERLRFVLALQRDQYLPLKVIRDYLDAIDRGERPENLPGGMKLAPRAVSDDPAEALRGRSRRLTEAQLRTESGAGVRLVKELLDFGIITHQDGLFDECALQVTLACAKLEAQGLQPRHLRPVLASAEREFALVERAVAPLASRRDGASQARAAEAARELSGLLLDLHQAVIQGQIARLEK